jgi:3-oxoacyl-[acyl-carrier protein] reductase
MDLGLGGRGHLVTGASRGLGSAAARALVPDGARAPVDARSTDAVDTPPGRVGEPAGFDRVAASLLSPAASSVTGTTVAVDGGRPRTP